MTKKPPNRRREKPRYEDLLQVSTDLFSQHGYERTTVRMIAEEMGVLSGSLYSHISSKDEILLKIISSIAALFGERVRNASRLDAPAEDRLQAMCRAHLSVLNDRQAAVTVYYNQWRLLPEQNRKSIVELRSEYEQLFVELIQDGIKDGTFNDVSVRDTVLVILSACNWTYQWYSNTGDSHTDEIADRYLKVILEGLRAK